MLDLSFLLRAIILFSVCDSLNMDIDTKIVIAQHKMIAFISPDWENYVQCTYQKERKAHSIAYVAEC